MKIRKTATAFVFFILAALFDTYAQSGAIMKHLSKGEYEVAYEKLSSSYKDTNSTERFGLLYHYYADTLNPSQSPCKAYYYATKFNAQSSDNHIAVKEFTEQTLSRLYSLSDIEGMEDFVECFKPETEYVKEATRLLEQMAFTQAQKEGTLQAYEAYVEKYPQALQTNLAKQEIDRLVVEDILESEDLQKLRQFVLTNNNQQYVARAKKEIEKLVFAQALETNTVESYSDYLAKYPEGSYKKLASQRLDEVLYVQATKNGKLSSLIDFINTNSNHPQWQSAYEMLKRQTKNRLSIAGMRTLATFEQDTQYFDYFVRLYLTDTRKATIDTLLSYFPSLTGSQRVKNAESIQKKISSLLAKPFLGSEDVKVNKNLFALDANMQSYQLVEKYLSQSDLSKVNNKSVPTDLMLSLQQSERLPLFVENEAYTEHTDMLIGQSKLFFAHTQEGFAYESASDNNDIYAISENPYSTNDTILLPTPVNTRYNETNPLLSTDGKTLFFSSNSGVNYGGLDIYVSHREDTTAWDNWSEPILLGSKVNGKEDDVAIAIKANQLLVQSGKTKKKKICVLDKEPEFIHGYLLNQNGRFLKGEILILDSLTLDTLFITHSNHKGYFAYLKPDRPYLLHSQKSNYINFFSSDLSQVVLQSIEELISSKKLFIAESPFSDKHPEKLTLKGKRELEYFAKSVSHIKYTITISVHVHTEKDVDKAAEISDKQADEIIKLLMKNGIPKDKLIVVGYGARNNLIGWEGKDRIEIGFLNN